MACKKKTTSLALSETTVNDSKINQVSTELNKVHKLALGLDTGCPDLDALTARVDQNEADITDLKEDLNDVHDVIGGDSLTITPDANDKKDGYYSRNNQTAKLIYATSTVYYTVEPIDISSFAVGSNIQMKASINSAYGVFIADASGNVLEYVNGSNAADKGYTTGSTPQLVTLTIPQDAKYITSDIRMAYYTDISNFAVTGKLKNNITIINQEIAELQEAVEAIDGNVFNGKKWVACGDSFTAGAFNYSLTNDYTFTSGKYAGMNKVYPYWIGNRNSGLTVVNEAISGSTMGAGENGVNPFSGTRYTAIPSDADYITLAFGINDSGHGVPIGTIDDDDNTTFYGAWNVVLEYLITNFPFAHIGIIVGAGMQTSNGQQYANAEIAVAKKWGIPYLNIQFESGGEKIPLMLRTNNPDVSSAVKTLRNTQQYVNPSTDTPNYHPNEDAHEFESHFIEAWLRTL